MVDEVFGAHAAGRDLLQVRECLRADAVEQLQVSQRAQLFGQVAQHEVGKLQRLLAALFGLAAGVFGHDAEDHRDGAERCQRGGRPDTQPTLASVLALAGVQEVAFVRGYVVAHALRRFGRLAQWPPGVEQVILAPAFLRPAAGGTMQPRAGLQQAPVVLGPFPRAWPLPQQGLMGDTESGLAIAQFANEQAGTHERLGQLARRVVGKR